MLGIKEAIMGRPRTPLAQRFWSKVRKTASCWLWTAYKDKDGYGQIEMPTGGPRGKPVRATRIALELAGRPSPSETAFACHTCDNPSCVNPGHLYWGTGVTNAADRGARNRQAQGSKHGMSKLSEQDVQEIHRLYYTEDWTASRIAKLFEVSDTTVCWAAS